MKRTIIKENFKSLHHMLHDMEQRPVNNVFEHSDLSSQRPESKRREWYGTATYKDAINVIQAGYKDPLEKMKKAILKIGRTDTYKRPRLKTAVVGFVPHVPNFVQGLPEAMITRDPVRARAKTINLVYSFGASASIETEQIIKAGVNFISLVNSLEKQGFSVKIDLLFSTITKKTSATYTVTVKDFGQRLNLLKLAFPLVHPSMLRRVSFKWLETVPELKDKLFNNGYGVPLTAEMKSIDKERAFLYEHDIVRKEAYYMNVYQCFRAENIQELARSIGL